MKWLFIGMIMILPFSVLGCGQSEYNSSINEKSNKIEFKDIDDKTAFMIALDDAEVPQEEAYNIKIEEDGDNGIPIYDIEFETNYGDYDYEIAIENGAIVKADYEVDEQWLDKLGGNPITIEEAQKIVQGKIYQVPLDKINIREENSDGRGRYEGELFFNDRKYEFEIDQLTGIIFDWNVDLRK